MGKQSRRRLALDSCQPPWSGRAAACRMNRPCGAFAAFPALPSCVCASAARVPFHLSFRARSPPPGRLLQAPVLARQEQGSVADLLRGLRATAAGVSPQAPAPLRRPNPFPGTVSRERGPTLQGRAGRPAGRGGGSWPQVLSESDSGSFPDRLLLYSQDF